MISFKVTNRNRILELKRELRPRAGRAINAWARNVLAIANQLANEDTGDMKRSGHIVNYADTVGDGRQRGVAKSIVYDESYTRYVHDGTSNYVGNPFLLAAFEACRAQLAADLAAIYEVNQ